MVTNNYYIKKMKLDNINELDSSPRYYTTLNELQSTSLFKDIKVFADTNKEICNRKIKSVTVLEDKQFELWLKGGELILSTLQHFETVDKQINLINSLVIQKASCLAFHPGNSGIKLHSESIDYSIRKELPILLIPKNRPYTDIFDLVYGRIINKQFYLIKQSNTIRKRLTNNFLKGDNLLKIATTVSELIRNPVIVTDNLLSPLAFTSYSEKDKHFLYDMLQNIKFLKEKLKTNTNQIKQNMVFRYLLEYKSSTSLRGMVYPVLLNNDIIRYLHVWEYNNSIKDLDYMALTHASTIITLDAMKENLAFKTKERLVKEFIQDLLENRIKNVESVKKRSEELNFYLDKNNLVIVLKVKNMEQFYLDNYEKGEKYIQAIKSKIKNVIDMVLNTFEYDCYSTWISGSLIILLSVKSTDDAKKVGNIILNKIEKQTNDNINFSIGIGCLYKKPLELYRSYQEAKEAIKLGEKLFEGNKKQNIALYHFSDLGIFQIFKDKLEDKFYLKKFCEDYLQSIIDFEEAKTKDLLKTLETFLDCNQSFKKTSELLFIHQNTVKYRIKKIKDILSYSPFENPNECFNLHLAVKAYKIL